MRKKLGSIEWSVNESKSWVPILLTQVLQSMSRNWGLEEERMWEDK